MSIKYNNNGLVLIIIDDYNDCINFINEQIQIYKSKLNNFNIKQRIFDRCMGYTEATFKDYSSNKEKYLFQNKLLKFLKYNK